MKKLFLILSLFPTFIMASSSIEFEVLTKLEYQAKSEATLFASVICPSVIRKSIGGPSGRQAVSYFKKRKAFFDDLTMKNKEWLNNTEFENKDTTQRDSLTLFFLKNLPIRQKGMGAVFFNGMVNGVFIGDNPQAKNMMQYGSLYFKMMINSQNFSDKIDECSDFYGVSLDINKIKSDFSRADKSGSIVNYATLLAGGVGLFFKGLNALKGLNFIKAIRATKGWEYSIKFLSYFLYIELAYNAYDIASNTLTEAKKMKQSAKGIQKNLKGSTVYGQCNEDISPLNWPKIYEISGNLLRARELFVNSPQNEALMLEYEKQLKLAYNNKNHINELVTYHEKLDENNLPCDLPKIDFIVKSNKITLNFLSKSIEEYEVFLKSN